MIESLVIPAVFVLGYALGRWVSGWPDITVPSEEPPPRQPYGKPHPLLTSECVNGSWRSREFEIPDGEERPPELVLARIVREPDGRVRRFYAWQPVGGCE